MHVNSIGYPSTQFMESVDEGGRAILVTGTVTGPPNSVFRAVHITGSSSNPYVSSTLRPDPPTGTDIWGFINAQEDDSYTFEPAATGNFEIRFSTAGSPPNQAVTFAFEFDLEIESPPSSGIFVPVSYDNCDIVFDGDDVAETSLPPPPQPVYCFWTDLLFVSQSACVPPPDGPQPEPPWPYPEEQNIVDMPGFSFAEMVNGGGSANADFFDDPEDDISIDEIGRIVVTVACSRGIRKFYQTETLISGPVANMKGVRREVSSFAFFDSLTVATPLGTGAAYANADQYMLSSGAIAAIVQQSGGDAVPMWQFGEPDGSFIPYFGDSVIFAIGAGLQSSTNVAAPTRMVMQLGIRFIVVREPPPLPVGYYRDITAPSGENFQIDIADSTEPSVTVRITMDGAFYAQVYYRGGYAELSNDAPSTMVSADGGGESYILLYSEDEAAARVAVFVS